MSSRTWGPGSGARRGRRGDALGACAGLRAAGWCARGPCAVTGRRCSAVGEAMAATFFGEVVKAPCRAGTEDEEEDEEKTETPEDREVRRKLARKR